MTVQSPDRTDEPRQRETRRLVAAGAIVSVFGLVTKAIGQLRESVLALLFGATRAMDAFNVAKSIPDMVASWIETPVRASVVPIFTKHRAEAGEAEAWRAASNLMLTLGLGLFLLCGLFFAGAGVFVRMFSAGFRDPAAWNDATRLARIVVLSFPFAVMCEFLGGFSNVYGRQFVPALGRVVNGTVVLACVWFLGPKLGLAGYAWGFLFGAIAYCLIQTDILWRNRKHLRFVVQPNAPEVREVLRVGFPLFIGMLGPRIDVILDQNFASFLAEGSLSILFYMRALSAAFTELVQTVSLAVLLPHFSSLAAEKRFDALRSRVTETLEGYLFLATPLVAFVCCGSRPIVELLYHRGNFTDAAAVLAALILPILTIAEPAYGGGQILAQVHFSGGNTKTPMYVGFWRIGFKAVLSLALIVPLGVVGLAVASSAATFFRAAQLWHRLPANIRPDGRHMARAAIALAVPTAIACAAVLGLFHYLPPFGAGVLAQALRLGVVLAISSLLYLGTALVLRNELAFRVIRLVRNRPGRA